MNIPERAVKRLEEEREGRLFTSDLTVSEFLLARDAEVHPISQVMGSCIYHVGQIPDYKGATKEIDVISNAHRASRAARAATTAARCSSSPSSAPRSRRRGSRIHPASRS